MIPRVPTRALLRGAAYGGGGVGMLGTLAAAGYALMKLEARLARKAVPRVPASPVADGTYGDPAGVPLRLAMLGDSGAAGFGADLPEETLGALLATHLAEAGRYVTLDVFANIGARCSDLDTQVSWTLLQRPDLVVIQIGANDVTHWVPPRRAVADLVAAVTRLRDNGVRVVVGTCPDLGTLGFVPQPLRAYGHLKCAQMAAAQAMGVVGAGGVPVTLGTDVARRFATDPEMFSFDRFHPSAKGYRAIAAAMVPAVRAAAGLDDDAPLPA